MSEAFIVSLTSVTGGARLDGTQQRAVIIQDSDIAHGAVQWRHGVTSINSVSSLLLTHLSTTVCSQAVSVKIYSLNYNLFSLLCLHGFCVQIFLKFVLIRHHQP